MTTRCRVTGFGAMMCVRTKRIDAKVEVRGKIQYSARTKKELSAFSLARQEHGDAVEFLRADVELLRIADAATRTGGRRSERPYIVRGGLAR